MDIKKEVGRAIEKYELFGKGDRVGVAVSGGKDSIVLLSVLKELGYDVVAIMIDLEIGEWSRRHLENVGKFCDEKRIKFRVFDFRDYFKISFGEAIEKIGNARGVSRCTICGTAKKWGLNHFARMSGVDVLATGHNLDDECQNVLMNYLKGNLELGAGLGPVSGVRDDLGFVKRVKPFFFIPEAEILAYSKDKGFDILYNKCPNAVGTYRVIIREWMEGNMSDAEKGKVVRGFLEKVGGLKGEGKILKKCRSCGEVCSEEVCKFCEIVEEFGKS